MKIQKNFTKKLIIYKISLIFLISLFCNNSLYGMTDDEPSGESEEYSHNIASLLQEAEDALEIKEYHKAEKLANLILSIDNYNIRAQNILRSVIPESQPEAGDRKVFNVEGIEFAVRYIPSGSYLRGSPETEEGRWPREIQHKVTITQSFWMMETEVTQKLYERIMGNNPSYFQGENNPVESITWNDAVQFCEKLSKITGRTWTLPTEAEWEYACRAGTTTPFYYGESLDSDMANFNGRFPYGQARRRVNRRRTVPVASFEPNAWGLYDMHGNVWEWCYDWYGEYPNYPVTDPKGPPRGSGKVFRGGGWNSHGEDLRSANWYVRPVVRENDLGFRAVLR